MALTVEPGEAAAGKDFDLGAFIRKGLGPDACELYAETHRQVDRLLLPRVLDYTRGSQHKAASLLGIARQTLRLKLREQGSSTASWAAPDDEEHVRCGTACRPNEF